MFDEDELTYIIENVFMELGQKNLIALGHITAIHPSRTLDSPQTVVRLSGNQTILVDLRYDEVLKKIWPYVAKENR